MLIHPYQTSQLKVWGKAFEIQPSYNIQINSLITVFKCTHLETVSSAGWYTTVKIIKSYLISIVWLHNQCIEMCVDIIFAANIFVNKEILALVTKYDMNFLCSWPTNVGSKHNFIRCFSMHIFWFQLAVKDFCISTTTVNVLFMFHSELNN